MRCLITGGGGYIGVKLTSELVKLGHEVFVLDLFWFGDFLPESKKVHRLKKDVRQICADDLYNTDVVFHFAGIANDPSSTLDPALCWDIACTSTYKLAYIAAAMKRPPRIIFASSGSVYGVKTEDKVTEDLELLPMSTYNKSKIGAERILLSFCQDIRVQIVRPGTVCGVSPRMRLDLAVNLLTAAAVREGIIRVLGGKQFRPNIHIDDLVRVYIHLLSNPELEGIFNAGFENLTIDEIAELISEITGASINHMPSDDSRSYRIDSSKLLATGFKPKKTVQNAIEEVLASLSNRTFRMGEFNSNVNWMRYLIAGGVIEVPKL